MKSTIHSNLNSGALRRAAAPLVGAALCTFMVLGVAAVPSLKIRAARQDQTVARERALRRRVERHALEELRATERPERIARASTLLRGKLGPAPGEMELHSLVRLYAAGAGMKLESIQFGDVTELGQGFFDARTARQEVHLAGRGDLGAISAFLDALDGIEQPTSTLELGLSRNKPSETSFNLRLSLGVGHVLPGRPTTPSEPGMEFEEPNMDSEESRP